MSDEARAQALEAARALEKQGQVDPAVRSFLRAGSVADAARVLAAAKRYADAGHLVMESLGVGPALVGGLDAEQKRLAMKAAVCFAQAGEAKKAVELLVALGDFARAAEGGGAGRGPGGGGAHPGAGSRRSRGEGGAGHQRDGGRGGTGGGGEARAERAARGGVPRSYVQVQGARRTRRALAYKLKRFADAAQLFEDAGMAFEAAACFAEAGDKKRCLDAVLRVPRDHPKYRIAAAQAIRAASDLSALDFKLDQLLRPAPFVADGPKDEREVEALLRARQAVSRGRGFPENAR